MFSLSCLPSSGVLQQRLLSQDAAGEAVVPGCSSRGCRPRMQRLSSQDAAGEAVVPGCSRASQQRILRCEEE
ncbi:hypothetical protein CgunFtcFv8_020424 [Champsocephalus gunnari]|uniref:Uncharacterized protein n=1 Tax=Champsocephalus gunnari TaxID=52237 RepID=A0AAN8E4L8_CHAGU|nr:hypothetical protein CgunFtcFv8_020424 [Champsocephalus gunnari]